MNLDNGPVQKTRKIRVGFGGWILEHFKTAMPKIITSIEPASPIFQDKIFPLSTDPIYNIFRQSPKNNFDAETRSHVGG